MKNFRHFFSLALSVTLIANSLTLRAMEECKTPATSSSYHTAAVDVVLATDNAEHNVSNHERALLISAAIIGDLIGVECALDDGTDVDTQDNKGRTALHWAIFNNHEKVVLLLLANHAHIDAQDKLGYTPLHVAVCDSNAAMVQLLLENNANITITTNGGKTAARLAQPIKNDDEATRLNKVAIRKSIAERAMEAINDYVCGP